MVDLRSLYPRIDWDLSTNKINSMLGGKQSDTGRGAIISLVQNGMTITPTVETLRVKFLKPDGTSGYASSTLENGKFYVESISQIFSTAGRVICNLELKVGTEFINSMDFIIDVQVSLTNSGIESSNDYSALQTLIIDTDTSEAQRVIDENIRKVNEVAREAERGTILGYMETTQQTMQDFLAMVGSDIATLTNGKLSPSQIPLIAINDTFVVSSEAGMLTLTAQRGDVALIMPNTVVTNSFILSADDATLSTNWKKMGVSYVAEAGHATTATSAEDSTMVNGHRVVVMNQAQYDLAVKDAETLYLVSGV